MQYQIGWVLIGITTLNILINMSIMIVKIIKQFLKSVYVKRGICTPDNNIKSLNVIGLFLKSRDPTY